MLIRRGLAQCDGPCDEPPSGKVPNLPGMFGKIFAVDRGGFS